MIFARFCELTAAAIFCMIFVMKGDLTLSYQDMDFVSKSSKLLHHAENRQKKVLNGHKQKQQ